MCTHPRFLCEPDWIDILGLIGLATVWCTGLVSTVSLCMLSTKYRHNGFVKHREYNLTAVFSVILIFEMFISRTYLHCYCIFMVWGFDTYPNFEIGPPVWTKVLIYSIFWLIMALQTVRIWKLHYNQQMTIAVMDDLWASRINPTVGFAKNNWFIHHKSTYGSTLWLCRIFVPITVISVAIGLLFTAYAENIAVWPQFFNILWMAVPSALSCYILYQTRFVAVDIFGIKQELLWSTICILFGIIAYFVTFLLFSYSDSAQNSVTFYRITWVSYSFISSTIMIGLSLTTVLCPIYSNQKIVRGVSNNVYGAKEQLSFNKVLMDPIGFRLFMRYLASEFAMEALNFIAELTQYRNHIQHKMIFKASDIRTKHKIVCDFRDKFHISRDDGIDNDEYYSRAVNLKNLKLCAGLVLSPIVIEQQNSVNVSEAMIYLYNKYMSESSQFPIAISSQNMRRIENMLFAEMYTNPQSVPSGSKLEMERVENLSKDSEDEDILYLFDDVAIELLYCLHDSFLRFRQGSTYIEYSKSTPIITIIEPKTD